MNEEKINDLLIRIKRLEDLVQTLLIWREQKEKQQISYPLDDTSRNIISRI